MKYVYKQKTKRKSLLSSRLLLLVVLIIVFGTTYVLHKSNVLVRITGSKSQNNAIELSEDKDEKIETVEYSTKIVFMGDTMLGRVVGPAILKGEDPFEHVRPILSQYDKRIANIESVIADPAIATTPAKKAYTFNAPLGVIDSIKSVPIDLGVLANNHTGDYGREAITDMLGRLDRENVQHVGLGNNIDEAYEPYIMRLDLKPDDKDRPKQRLKIAFVAYNDFENIFSDAGIKLPGSAFFDKARLAASVQSAKDDGAKMVFVIPHWGTEFQLNSFNSRQESSGQWLIDNGADAIIGNHPHVIQPTVYYKEKPIVYSLGNFVFSGMESIPNTGRGQMVGFTITQQIKLKGNEVVEVSEPVLSQPEYHFYNLNMQGYPVPE